MYQTRTRTHPHLILHMCYCVEVNVNCLNYKRSISWWMVGRVVIRYITQKKKCRGTVQVAGKYKIVYSICLKLI